MFQSSTAKQNSLHKTSASPHPHRIRVPVPPPRSSTSYCLPLSSLQDCRQQRGIRRYHGHSRSPVRGCDDPSQSSPGTATLDDLLQVVLHRLPPADVARATCFYRLWRAVASDRAVLEAAFHAPWGMRRVLGDPTTRAFWRAASLARFALSHTVRRGDTVPGVALKYSVQSYSPATTPDHQDTKDDVVSDVLPGCCI
ncbi:uncharacterized protein LOC123428596 [Hordeum vulgare subsp. vulgare]|uniref:uncharacterized protein LOC123428596 n=1 Tax=Hordeum vulgare subsp. vulgare TaxID=112509 RepID=UPI001D1A47A9|nr:uncharacterized protein LOC123428596 [Hordeum vulgare subsp. vulgare]